MSERLQDLASGKAEPTPKGLGAWFAGRARRREYWAWVVPSVLVGVTLAAMKVPGAAYIMSLPILFANIRRLHDLGHSGWFAPVINIASNVVAFGALALFGQAVGGVVSLLVFVGVLV